MSQLTIRPVYSPETFEPVRYIVSEVFSSELSEEESIEALRNLTILFEGTEEECKQFIQNK